MQFDWSAIWPAIPILLEGAKMTLWIRQNTVFRSVCAGRPL
jgi:hypothetical protein